LFYPEIAPDLIDRLNAIALPIDLFITTERSKQAAARCAFSKYRHGAVNHIEVPNRGRDIGPFLTELERPLAEGNYEVVGHLHSKRSIAIDAAMGDRWRGYLFNILLGDTFSHLLDLFLHEPKLGLIFPEDRHAVGWNKNYEIARDLGARAIPKVTAPSYPYFPLGTMFWARRDALSPLWSLKLKIENFPLEPAPNDGTVLHAVERLLPAACEAAGFDWCTVYDRRYAW
jgi:lipopolysaccharide biosynthesis protein